tara:strand:- start:1236 stop:1658 length:423 start_codon:yes stop_codon:yes gene_type:complete
MRVIETKVYEISEHPTKDLCFQWLRENMHDLNDISLYELMDSIKKLTQEIGGKNDYSISQSPCRGEFIKFYDYDQETLDTLDNECFCFWEGELIKGIKENNLKQVLDLLHEDTEYVYSDDGLTELCESNGYEFNEQGKLI